MKSYQFIEKQGLRLTQDSFSSCFINPEAYPETLDLSTTPQLAGWIEFQNVPGKYGVLHIRNAQVIRYIIAMYDYGSPFKGLDYRVRKVCAAEYAGFRHNSDGVFAEEVQRILNCELEIVNRMVICYCKISKNILFTSYIQLYINYHEKTLMNEKTTAKMIAEDMNAIMNYEQQLLAFDSSVGLRKDLYKIVADEEMRARMLRPEYKAEEYFKRFPTVILTSTKVSDNGKEEDDI